ncbi:PilZ domain-containing protein [Myxococcota bacterium]
MRIRKAGIEMIAQTHQDRRKHDRHQLGHYIPVTLPNWNDFAVWARDISPGGIGLAVDRRVTPGDRFIFRLPDEDDAPHNVEAEVCNVCWRPEEQRCWAGLRWLPRKTVVRDSLNRFVRALARPLS